jgi:tetratricopeptide (TPR) repeat protein
MQYRNKTTSLPKIAAQLGVAKLIEGSVFRVDNKVRITVTLINALLDEHIWSQSFEGEAQDVMVLQNEIAQAIAQQVEVAIRPEEQDLFDSAESIDPAAYEAFLKGQFHVQRFTPQDVQLAAQYFQQAMELDPDHALAWTGMATLCAFQAQLGVIKPQDARTRCLPAIMRALALDDSLPDAQLAYAVHLTWLLYNFDEGEAAFQRAIELNPSSAYAHLFYSHLLTLLGRMEEGTEHVQLALELDPLNPFVQGLYGVQLLMTGDIQGARQVTEDVLAANPGFGFGPGQLVSIYHQLGEKDKAIAQAAYTIRHLDRFPEGAEALEAAYAESDYSGAMLAAAQAFEERAKNTHVGPFRIGRLYELAGEAEKAIDWYETGYQITGPSVPYLGAMSVSPDVRSNPRFIKLLREVKLDYWADKFSKAGD